MTRRLRFHETRVRRVLWATLEYLHRHARARGSGRCVLFNHHRREVCTVWLN